MPGSWLTLISRRLLCEQTFEQIVSPAIADLQCEATRGLMMRVRHSFAVGTVLTWALFHDFSQALIGSFDGDGAIRVWRRAGYWSLGAALANSAVSYVLLVRSLDRWQVEGPLRDTALSTVLLGSVLSALTVAVLVAAYSLKRQNRADRRVVPAVIVLFAVVTLVSSIVTITLRAPSREAMAELGRATYGIGPAAYPPLMWQALMSALHVVPFAWLGTVLARHHGWRLALSATAILGTWQLINFRGFVIYLWLSNTVPALQPLLFGTYPVPTNLLTLTLLILAWRRTERRIDRYRVAHA